MSIWIRLTKSIDHIVNAHFKTIGTDSVLFIPGYICKKVYRVSQSQADNIKLILSKYYLFFFSSVGITALIIGVYSLLVISVLFLVYYIRIRKIVKCYRLVEATYEIDYDKDLVVTISKKSANKSARWLLIGNLVLLLCAISIITDLEMRMFGIIGIILFGGGAIRMIYILLLRK